MSYYNDNHPIEQIMKSAMSNLKTMIDTNTVIGTPVKTPEGNTIIPISRVTVGFVAGGGEYASNYPTNKYSNPDFPFAGGSGSGFHIVPVGFLIGENGTYKVLSVDASSTTTSLFELVAKTINSFAGAKEAQVEDKEDEK